MNTFPTQCLEERVTGSSVASCRQRFVKLLLIVVLSFCSYLFFSRMVVTAVEVRGSSMSPTLLSGDRVILNRFAFLHRSPQRGEMVVLKDPETGDLVVKRIIALPRETVQLRGEVVYVNDQPLAEPYVSRQRKVLLTRNNPVTSVPRDHYFVLGDNRNNSSDSRAFGPVPRESIVGVISL
jgi:signal peptidase I